MVKGSKWSKELREKMLKLKSPGGACKRGHLRTPENTSADGWCKICKSIMGARWRKKNYEKWTTRSRQTQAVYRSKHQASIKLRDRNLKIEVLTHYGANSTLQCCWRDCLVTDVDVLTIDHIQNDGAKDRKPGQRHTGKDLYRKLRLRGYPSGYQTLCANHQLKKELLRHRKEEK